MKVIIVHGLRRSGNHFLISTILQQFTNYVHINNVSLSYNEYIKWEDIIKTKERIDSRWTGFKDVECVVISIENQIINNVELDNFRKIDNCYFFVLLRSPYCNFSSIWKVYNKNKDRLLEVVKLWKIYAEYFLNNNNNEFIKILYDEFSTNDTYMCNLIKKLGVDSININKDKYIEHQISSFDLKSIDKQQVYKSLEDCVFKDDEVFLELVKDKEIDKLWDVLLREFRQ